MDRKTTAVLRMEQHLKRRPRSFQPGLTPGWSGELGVGFRGFQFFREQSVRQHAFQFVNDYWFKVLSTFARGSQRAQINGKMGNGRTAESSARTIARKDKR